MDKPTSDELQAALRPIESLISKSEKAQARLAPGTWQHTMLADNLRALHLALAIMTGDATPHDHTRDDLHAAAEAIASMVSRSEMAQAKFAPGTSHHSLLRNRIGALRLAEALIAEELQHP